MKRIGIFLLGCLLLALAVLRFTYGEPDQMWRAYVSLFLGLGNIVISIFWEKSCA